MTTADSWKEDGNEKYKNKDYRGAIESYSAAIQLDAQNGTLYTNRAAARLMLVQYKEAVDDCNTAIALSNSNAKAYFRKVTALKGLGRLSEALDTVLLGLHHDPTNKVALQEKHNIEEAKVRMSQAKALLDEKKYSRSLAVVDDLLRDLGSGCRELNVMKVSSLIELRRLEEALNLTNAMMRVTGSNDNELLMLRSRCLYRMGDLENALKHLKEAMRADPDNSEIRKQLRHVKLIEEQKEKGSTAYKTGNYQEAIDLWLASIAMDAENRQYNSKLHSNCANAYARLKQHEAAVKACDASILCDRSNIKAYLRRAESNYALNTESSLNAAIKDYEKVAELQGPEGGEGMKEKIRKAKIAIKMTKRKDLYKILGVTRDAGEDEIKKAYKKMALKCHPDKQAGKTDEEREAAVNQFKAIGEAYEILSDPEKKGRYDEGVDIEDLDNPHGGHGHGGHGGMDPNILFQMFMQQQQAGMRGGGGGFHFG